MAAFYYRVIEISKYTLALPEQTGVCYRAVQGSQLLVTDILQKDVEVTTLPTLMQMLLSGMAKKQSGVVFFVLRANLVPA